MAKILQKFGFPSLELVEGPSIKMPQLCELTGVGRRSIDRFISAGLVDRRIGHARKSRYLKSHYDQVVAVKAALARGESLEDQAARKLFDAVKNQSGQTNTPDSVPDAPEAIAIIHVLSPSIELHVRGKASAAEEALLKLLLKVRKEFIKAKSRPSGRKATR